ncbi:MAG: DUF444 family protein [Microscillaceae bacterium]|jgi:hypothetical protein|nr:DUF444 family protein [Microscillaceae bacterium]
MDKKILALIQQLQARGLPPEHEELINREAQSPKTHTLKNDKKTISTPSIYTWSDVKVLLQAKPKHSYLTLLKTIDELLEQDQLREKDGFPRRIRLGKLVKPIKGSKGEVIIVPTTTETKFYHDDDPQQQQEETTGGVGEGDVGEVIGEQKANPQPGEGEGQGSGQGEGSDHDMTAEAFDLGRILTEKFELPNLKNKGSKKSLTKMQYDLTDQNQGFGQILDKKATLKKVIQTNILLGKVQPEEFVNQAEFTITPEDKVYKILSPEKDVEAQAMVFFLRDYSGSMEGKPSEVISSQHLFIYSWLVYQYNNNVQSRFILHDTEAKEVEDFYTYYKSNVAGGTNIFPAFDLVNKIVEDESLAKDYNIYVFHGTDGDDWDYTGEKMLSATRQMLTYVNRLGITVAKNSWSHSGSTTVEKYLETSGILKEKAELIRMDSLFAEKANESRIIEGIKRLVA